MSGVDSANPIDPAPAREAEAQSQGHAGTAEYFKRLRRRLEVGLLIAYLVPLSILSLYFHFQFNLTLKESGKLHLLALAESQRNTMDLFLQERVVNIFNLFHMTEFTLSPAEQDMQSYLNNLREGSDAFVDVGFFNESGVQIGYAGPYPFLHGRDYSREQWFRTMMGQERNYYISDIYLGFRQKPHFTIAVRQLFDGKPFVMRATLDPDKFYMFLRGQSRGKGVDSSVLNQAGRYQIVDPDRGELLGPSDYAPPAGGDAGTNEIKGKAGQELVAYARLREAPWCLMVRQPVEVAYAEMYRARTVMIAGTAALVLIMIVVIWLIVTRLLRRAQAVEESRAQLKSQLLHAAKLVSVGELAGGVAHEINNPLAIISAESGLIRDMLDPRFGATATPDKITEALDQVDKAVFRARNVTEKLLSFVRKSEHRMAPCSLNRILDEAVAGVKEQEFKVSNIKLVRDYAPDLPELMLDPDQVRQVFLNIINNAHDAINGPGKITLTTRHDNGTVRAAVTDTGSGMSSEQMQKIFMPFFTTKEVGKGTGLGLPISLNIVEAMGGRIEVQSMPGAGSSFTVVFPRTASGQERREP